MKEDELKILSQRLRGKISLWILLNEYQKIKNNKTSYHKVFDYRGKPYLINNQDLMTLYDLIYN